MNQNPVGIGTYATPGCGCGRAQPSLGANGALGEMTWVLGVGAVVVLGIAAVVVAQSFKQAGF